MGEKDRSEKYLEAYDDVFADIFNVLVFGEDIIIPDFLTNAGTETIYKSKEGKLRNQFRDVQKNYNESHIQIAYLSEEIRDKFKSDFKVVADFFAEKRLGTYDASKHKEKIMHVEAVLEMLRVFTKDERYKGIEEDIIKNNVEGDISMCKVLDEYERKGIEKGILNLVKNNRLSVEVACEELNISKEEFEEKLENYKLSLV